MVNKKKMLSPKTTIWWVPASGVVNYRAITVAEITAGVNISCAIQTGYTLNPTDPDTDDSKSICENSNAQNPTFDNYEASLPLFRGDVAETTGVFYQAYQLFKKPDAKGYLVRRIGKLNSAAVTTADTVSVFGVSSDVPADITSENGGPIGMTVPFLPTGELNNFYKLTA